MNSGHVDSVLMIHGPCMAHDLWRPWTTRYMSRGYSVISSAVSAERSSVGCADWYSDPAERAKLTAATGDYTRLADTLPGNPILIGHCYVSSSSCFWIVESVRPACRFARRRYRTVLFGGLWRLASPPSTIVRLPARR